MSTPEDQANVKNGQQHYLAAHQRAQDKATTFYTGRTMLEQLGSRGTFNQAVKFPPTQETGMNKDDTPSERSPKAKEAAASDVDGLHTEPNKLDHTEAEPPFKDASNPPAKQPPDKPDAALKLNTPAPGGSQQETNAPGPMTPEEREYRRQTLKKEMLAKREFNRKARDVDREH